MGFPYAYHYRASGRERGGGGLRRGLAGGGGHYPANCSCCYFNLVSEKEYKKKTQKNVRKGNVFVALVKRKSTEKREDALDALGETATKINQDH